MYWYPYPFTIFATPSSAESTLYCCIKSDILLKTLFSLSLKKASKLVLFIVANRKSDVGLRILKKREDTKIASRIHQDKFEKYLFMTSLMLTQTTKNIKTAERNVWTSGIWISYLKTMYFKSQEVCIVTEVNSMRLSRSETYIINVAKRGQAVWKVSSRWRFSF